MRHIEDGFRSRCLTRLGALAALTLTAGACATTGATLGSGVGDTYHERAPYYAGRPLAAGTEAIAHLPIAYQRGGSHSSILDPAGGAGTAVDALLAEMNAYLEALGATEPIVAERVAGTPPDVQFGCVAGAAGDCTRDVHLGRDGQPMMRLAVGRPSRGWVSSTQATLDSAGMRHTLVLTLEVGQYWPHQRNWRGDKEVRLGTGYDAPVPWLTALDAPVSVLQLTGALVDREGRAVRIGAEGLLARRTNLLLTSLGVQRLISDEDVEQLRAARRDDLPGSPRVWEVALVQLVAELTGNLEFAYR
jgi:hypothetical protein